MSDVMMSFGKGLDSYLTKEQIKATTPITEIVEQRDDYIKFKTQNSNYELFKIN